MITVKASMYRMSVFLIFQAYCSTGFSYKPSINDTPPEVIILEFKANNLVMKNNDYDVLNSYLSNCLDAANEKDFSLLCNRINSIVSTVLKINNPTNIQANKILAYIHSIKNHRNHNKDARLVKLVWLATLRNTQDLELLKKMISSQNDTDLAETSLSLLGEFGWYENVPEPEVVIGKLKSKELFLDLLKRKATFINKLNLGVDLNVEDLIRELTTSIHDVLPIVNDTKRLQLEHMHWLIKKMGLFRKNKKIQDILKSLESDPLHYNKNSLDGLSKENKLMVLSLVDERLHIKRSAQLALNPFLSENEIMLEGL